MKTDAFRRMILCICFFAFRASATTYYVDINSTNATPPYTNWTIAATDIQSAVNQTTNGDLVLVNPGVYGSAGYTAPDGALTAVVIPDSITVQSMIGASATLINGSNAMREVYLQNTSILVGFTITNGTTSTNSGGGICCANNGQTVSNCVIIGNSSYAAGPGNDQIGPGAGGVYNGAVYNCKIISNSAPNGNGGGAQNSTLINCLLTGNEATYGGGIYGGQLYNCTVVANNGSSGSGGGIAEANAANSIIYDNNANWYGGSCSYCCTVLLPSGGGNITNAPLFVDEAGGDFHLQSNSPCIDTGNNSYVAATYDIDGNPRVVNGKVDMGAYEYQNPNLPLLAIAVEYTNVATEFPFELRAVFNAGLATTTLWNFDDGTLLTNQNSVVHSWISPGIYTVTLTASNSFTTSNATASVTIWVSSNVTYVNVNGKTPVLPYSSWNTATTNIQSAINITTIPGSLILVSNGVYNFGSITDPDGTPSRVAVKQPLTLQSVNGSAATIINGGNAYRCVYLTNRAILSGFTLIDGKAANGGGVYCASTNATITNCTISYCSAGATGGGASSGTFNNCSLLENSSTSEGGGAFGGSFNNCVIANNSATSYGGGVYSGPGFPATLENCVVVSNSASFAGGGVFNYPSGSSAPFFDCLTNCVLTNCVLSWNSAPNFGSATVAAYLNNCIVNSNENGYVTADAGLLVGCTLIGNQEVAAEPGRSDLLNGSSEVLSNCTLVANAGGADDCYLYNCTLLQNDEGGVDSTLVNCLIVSNGLSYNNGGGAFDSTLTNCSLEFNKANDGGGAYQCTLVNCTVTANTAVTGGGIYNSTAQNCILYYNTNGDFYPNSSQYPLNYCCTSSNSIVSGFRNITNAPLFVNAAAANFHLQFSSPCINSGNNAYISSATTDLDGNPRIVGGTVDIGAYEYQTPTSVISYAYLQQYGLPTDGSVDFKDLDGTSFNVYQDWIAGLNPTNPAPVLAMLTPVTTNSATGVTVTWQSVSGIPYLLQRSTNLVSQPPFATVQSNITGQPNTTSFIDTTATNNVPYFYRVGVIAP